MGVLTHPNDTSFKVGNNVNIMNAKCNSEDLLKKRSNEWIENSAKTNNQTILSDLDKEYSLKNNRISVIEKAVTKDDKKRYYKFKPIYENSEYSDLYFYEQALNDAGVDTNSDNEDISDDETSEDDDLLKMLEGME